MKLTHFSYNWRNHLPKILGNFSRSACAKYYSSWPCQADFEQAFGFKAKPHVKVSSLGSANQEVYRWNVKIRDLGRLGQVKDARKLFDEMPVRDVVSYASMVGVYVKSNELREAESMFGAMPERNMVAESTMIHGYVKAGRMREARSVFDEMRERNVYSWTSLISGYFASGQVEEGRRMFDLMPEKNEVSWNTAVLGYARNGLLDEARSLFNKMPQRNTVTWTAMIKACVENGRIDEAMDMFHRMPRRNLYSWNIMLGAYLGHQRLGEAVELFHSMPLRNEVSWTAMVTGLAQNKLVAEAREYFDRMPQKDIAAWNAMITAYADEGLLVEANVLFDSMPRKDIITWNAMIGGYARHGSSSEALVLFVSLLRSCSAPDDTSFTSVLASAGGLLEVTQVHGLAIRTGFEDNTSIANALITVYSRCGDLGSSKLAFDALRTKDVVSWTALILAYSNHGHGKDALHIFGRMLKYGIKPDEITFVAVLSACGHAGLVDKGQRLFNSMRRVYGMEPKSEHYSCLVDILGRAGQVDEAMRVADTVPPSEQDGAFFGTVLGACRLHGRVELADHVGRKLLELEPSSSGGYVLLSNVYAAKGRWEDFARVRKKMKEMNVKKVAGVSQIEANGGAHTFSAADKSHPEFSEVYKFLNESLIPVMQGCNKGPQAGTNHSDHFILDEL
uniref:Uncharacterized protein n=1 Tax=Kalanchoe fedtschenkoi TaxID=63787 RepID=A0A7N0UD12_KALFE